MKKLRLVILCLACAGLLSVPAAADAQKERPGGKQRTSAKCTVLAERVERGNREVAGAQQAVAKAKTKVTKRKAAHKNASGKSKKAKAKKRLKKAKKALRAAKTELKADQQRLESENRRFAQAGCGG